MIQERHHERETAKHRLCAPPQRQSDEYLHSPHLLRESQASFRPLVLLRRPQVLAKLGIARATLYQWLDPNSPQYLPDMPRPIKLSAKSRCCYWVEAEVDQFIVQRVEHARRSLT